MAPYFTIFLLLTVVPSSSPLEFNYSRIRENNNLITQGNTTYLDSGIQLTANHTDQIGRVSFKEPLHLWDNSTGSVAVASFTTDFSFIIYAGENGSGDGMAFFLAQPPYDIPLVTDGSGIGLVSHEDLNSTSHPLVAVEFDTFRNHVIDPQDLYEHVGIDVNSMNTITTAWSCDIRSWNIYNATISYNSGSKNLSVVFTGYKAKVPIQQHLFYEIDLANYLPEHVSFGFSAANGFSRRGIFFEAGLLIRSWK